MDALSDVLRAVRLSGAVFFDVRAASPWVAATPPGRAIVRRMFPGSGHLISYHVLIAGSCWAGPPEAEPISMAAGDIIVFPHGDPHMLSSSPGMRTEADRSMYRPPREGQLPFALSVGSGAVESAHFVCGFLGCDARPFNPLLAALPPVIHVRDRSGALAPYVQAALAESRVPRIGGDGVLSRLSELMFVSAVRQHLEGLPEHRSDWLAGLRDPFIGRALNLMHADPARPWHLAALARAVGMSRSVLAERFTGFVGRPPMQYLAQWRMQLAASQLRSSGDSVASIATRVGYESEAAFSRSFKKIMGVSPGRWRSLENPAKATRP